MERSEEGGAASAALVDCCVSGGRFGAGCLFAAHLLFVSAGPCSVRIAGRTQKEGVEGCCAIHCAKGAYNNFTRK